MLSLPVIGTAITQTGDSVMKNLFILLVTVIVFGIFGACIEENLAKQVGLLGMSAYMIWFCYRIHREFSPQ